LRPLVFVAPRTDMAQPVLRADGNCERACRHAG
jgi:hypothetical protein